jgi:hypothetical protein
LTTDQLQPLIQRLIQRALVRNQHSYEDFTFGSNTARGRADSVRLLLALPAAQQLPADAVVALMTEAMKARDSLYACQLLQLPGAMHISRAELASMVEVAAAAQDDTILTELSKTPAFDHLEPAAAAAALLAAVEHPLKGNLARLKLLLDSKHATGVDVLVPALVQQLRSVQDFSSQPQGRLAMLLDKVTGQRKHALNPAAGEAALFSTNALLQVLESALVYNWPAFERLWPLTAATWQAKQLGQLLRCAATCHGKNFQHVLVLVRWCFQHHHAWSSVSEADKMAWLLRQAVQGGDDCSRYCAGQGAAAVDQALAARLLEIAVATKHSGNLEALLLLPAANQLGRSKVEQLLQMAVTAAVHEHAAYANKKALAGSQSSLGSQDTAAASYLRSCEQSAAAQLGSTSKRLSVLCRWHAAAGVCVDILAFLLSSSTGVNREREDASRIQVMQQICSSEAAASLSSEQLQSLLTTALSKRLCCSARALLHCPATADITATMLGPLLQCAFSSPDVSAPWQRPAAGGFGQRFNSRGVSNAADSSVAH